MNQKIWLLNREVRLLYSSEALLKGWHLNTKYWLLASPITGPITGRKDLSHPVWHEFSLHV
jgi:hypothetical protein